MELRRNRILSLEAMASTTEASTALNHSINQIVDEIESSLELSGGSSGGIGNDLTASDIEESLHGEILSGWFVADARGKGGVNDVDPVVDWSDHLFLDLGSADVDFVGGSDGESTSSGEKIIEDVGDRSDALLQVISSLGDAFAGGLASGWNRLGTLSRELGITASENFAVATQVSDEWAGETSTGGRGTLWLPLSAERETRLDKDVVGDGGDDRVLVLERSFLEIWNFWDSGEVWNLLLEAVRGLTGNSLGDLSSDTLLVLSWGSLNSLDGSGGEGSADGALSQWPVLIPSVVRKVTSSQDATVLLISLLDGRSKASSSGLLGVLTNLVLVVTVVRVESLLDTLQVCSEGGTCSCWSGTVLGHG